MYLEGQGVGGCRRAGEPGYAMAALLVTLGVMAVMMTAAMPVWRHQAQREKEAELIFRGEQYARAVALYQRKMGPGTIPPNIDTLVQQKFLRKKYKDPMVPDGEFQIVPFGGQVQPGQPGATQPQRGGVPGAGRGPQMSGFASAGASQPGGFASAGASPAGGQRGQSPGFVGGGVMGVVSKSKEASIRIYRGGSYYNQWRFVYVAPQPGPGQDGRGGRGPGQGPGGAMGPGRGGGRGPMGPGGGRGRGPAFPFPGGRGRGPGL